MSLTTFAPAASVTITVQPISVRYAMPPIDAGNLDVTISNVSATPTFIRFGGAPTDPALPCVPGQPDGAGILTLRPGDKVLLTTNATVATAGSSTGRVVNDGGIAGAATSVSLAGPMGGGSVIITRGTASGTITF